MSLVFQLLRSLECRKQKGDLPRLIGGEFEGDDARDYQCHPKVANKGGGVSAGRAYWDLALCAPRLRSGQFSSLTKIGGGGRDTIDARIRALKHT